MKYKISAINNQGKLINEVVEANNEEEAKIISSFDDSRVLKVKKISNLFSDMFKHKPKADDQVILLSAISATAESGQNVRKSTLEIIESDKRAFGVKDMGEFDDKYTLSEIIKHLNFDISVVALVEAGERTSKLGEMLRIASDTLKKSEQIKRDSMKAAKQGIIIFGIACVVLLFVPLVLGELVKEIVYGGTIRITTNVFTDIIMSLNYFYNNFYLLIFFVIGGIFAFRGPIWKIIRHFFPFNKLWNIKKTSRGVSFLTTYRPLLLSGINSLTSVGIMKKNSKGEDSEIYEDVSRSLISGRSISEAIDNENFPSLMRTGLKGFEKIKPDLQIKILESLIDSLVNINEVQSKRAGSALKFFSMGIVSLIIIALFAGIILPLQTMTPAY